MTQYQEQKLSYSREMCFDSGIQGITLLFA